MNQIETHWCFRCEQDCTAEDMRLTCPRNPEIGGGHEVIDPPEWKFGDPVRQGSSLHAADCEASNPSVWEEFDCNCGLLPPYELLSGTSSPVRDR